MARSERVMVQLHDGAEWRGDDLRFRCGTGDAEKRLHELVTSYRHIGVAKVFPSDDAPTHAIGGSGDLHALGALPEINIGQMIVFVGLGLVVLALVFDMVGIAGR